MNNNKECYSNVIPVIDEYGYEVLSSRDKLDIIQQEADRIWSYLKETIIFIEEKYYLSNVFDINELLIYCKSCEESYDEIYKLTLYIENDMAKYEC